LNEIRILVCDSIHPIGIEMLENAGIKVDVKPLITHKELIETVVEYDILLVRSRTKITKKVLNSGTRLKIIGRAGVGLDNIDLELAKKLNIKVVNSPEASTNAVTELVLGLMLSLARRIPAADNSMKRGKWEKSNFLGIELEGKVLGIIGFGRIGSLLAKKTKDLGMRVLTYDVMIDKLMNLVKSVGAEAVELDELLGSSDFVSIHVPLLPQTKHMIGDREFNKMKNGAYLINAARGGILNEKALIKNLKNGKLAGAALDVFEEEPPLDLSLTSLSNVVSLPHIGAATEEAQKANSKIISKKILEILEKSYSSN
jgi:D-3-phosphoglycerate dehydrogenase